MHVENKIKTKAKDMKQEITKKIIVTIIIVAVIIGGFAWHNFSKKEKPSFTLEKAQKGDIVQTVSETGDVGASDKIKLSFKASGKIDAFYAKVGYKVKAGQDLAKIDTTQLEISLSEAKASLKLAKARLNKLLAGASDEEVKLAETKVSNAKTALSDAYKNLDDALALSSENIKSAYQDALSVLEDAYLKIYNAYAVVDSIQETYFYSNDQQGVKVKDNKKIINKELGKVKSLLDVAKETQSNVDIDKALSGTKDSLGIVYNSLSIIRQICGESAYKNVVSQSDKESIDTQRLYINTAKTNISNSTQTISSTKITNQMNINAAKAKVSSAKGALEEAQRNLKLITAEPRQVDIDLYQAQIDQANSQISLLESKIIDSVLKSPVAGQIVEKNKEIGEIVQPGQPVFILLPESKFQVKVNIYEEDIVKVKVGQDVDINLVAFPNKTLQGKVVAIDPAEKVINDVVYYQVTIAFNQPSNDNEKSILDSLKNGMTADITIKTAFKKNVLTIPRLAIQQKEGKSIIKVFENGLTKEREIKTGIYGDQDKVEVISGLEEGDQVVIE